MFLIFINDLFIAILDQVWYLIVSIPDRCILSYLHLVLENVETSTDIYANDTTVYDIQSNM